MVFLKIKSYCSYLCKYLRCCVPSEPTWCLRKRGVVVRRGIKLPKQLSKDIA